MSEKTSIYIHIPFCLKKCNYCDFCSFPAGEYSQDEYVKSLSGEIKNRLLKHPISEIKTIYIGGGTPSLLNERFLEHIVNLFFGINFDKDYEFTLEVNPATAKIDYFRNLKSMGINRISLGAQSFDDNMLKILGRVHNSKDIFKAIEDINKAGIENVSFDLMYGLPQQSLEMWKDTLNKAVQLNVKHISAYGLKIEENTPFNTIYCKDHSDLPSDEYSEEMFYMGHEILTSAGFKHYEVSNYAIPGYESKHNINYWENNNYYAFGLGAHGYIASKRYENTVSMTEYMSEPLSSANQYTVKDSERIEEAIFLGFRMLDGINLKEFENRYNLNLISHYKNIFDKYSNYFSITENNVRLNLKGILLSNNILSEFL